MKYFTISILSFLFILVMAQSCYYDDPPELAPIKQEDVSFDTHILPIFTNQCSTSGCHDGNREPNLLPENAWNALRTGGYINLALPEESVLYKSVQFEGGVSGMPPGGPQLPEIDRLLILTWIQKGAPND